MKVVLQKVSEGSVAFDGKVLGRIAMGFVLLCGFGVDDDEVKLQWMVDKICKLRVFADHVPGGSFMDRSIMDEKGEVLIVSQFTVYGDCKKGTKPSFVNAAPVEKARLLYSQFVEMFRKTGLKVETGEFQAIMQVSLVNDGPLTLVIDGMKKPGEQ